MEALRWMRLARQGADGVAEVVRALSAETRAESARPMALALSRAGAAEGLGQVLASGGPAARLAAVEALETMSEARAGEVALRGHAHEPIAWLRRRRVALAAERGVAVEAAFNVEDPAVCSAILSRGLLAEDPIELALQRALPESGRVWDELIWWCCARAGADLGMAPLLEQAAQRGGFVAAQAARALVELGLAPVVDVPGLWRHDVPLDLEGVRALDDEKLEHVQRAALALGLTRDLDASLAAVGRLAGSAHELSTAALCAGTDHPRPAVRAAALRALDGRDGEAVWSALRRWVTDEPDPEQRTALVWRVARRREAQALDALVAWSSLADPDVRVAAVQGLAARVRKSGRARTPAVKAALQARAGDADGEVAALAGEALARFG